MARHYDLLTIGGGSGGVAVSNRAASYGAKCALIEAGRLGGTCVNVGCVPKKVMWNGASLAHAIEDAADYGFSITAHSFDWPTLKRQRDQHVLDLNGHYERNLLKNGVEIIRGTARFVGPKTIKVGADTVTAGHIIIAVGGRPVVPELPGAGFGITSDGFFELPEQPKNIAIVGGGYISVEFAGLLRALGSEVTMILRRAHFLNDSRGGPLPIISFQQFSYPLQRRKEVGLVEIFPRFRSAFDVLQQLLDGGKDAHSFYSQPHE